ncbi:MAG: flavodoxin family protein [Ruminococcaceae bacterium]|jgi:multimeric flavodoxin WrbA|nr:flavodoxin family protein [Oscillospiraceae bacterium]
MSKIIVVDGSPRVGKYTDQLTDAFAEGARSKGHEVIKFSLAKTPVAPCRHCMGCGKNGYCSQKDAMEALYPEIESCDMIVFASPIYFWHITAQMKSFIDRLYALYVMGRFPRKEMKLILVSGGQGDDMTNNAEQFFRDVFLDRIHWTDKGILKVHGTSAKDFDVSGYLKEAYDFGAQE